MRTFDVVIIGSGLGGLVCGALLSKHGYHVCVLEKNKQVGGCLQTFSRDKVVFDSGVHYVGGLEEGQNLHRIFSYLGIMDKLKIKKMDEDGFDHIILPNDPTVYKMGQGYDNFINGLLEHFPDEETALRQYCQALQDVCNRFPLYNLRAGAASEKEAVLTLNAYDYIASLTSNKKLQQVLAGNNILYAGVADKTPFYVHALITNSYIESSWRCVNGGSQIAKWLVRAITERGGVVERYKEVVKINERDRAVQSITLKDGEEIGGKHFISNIHPAATLAMTDSDMIRNAYRSRVQTLENTISTLMINIALHPDSFPYVNHNFYIHQNDVWESVHYTEDNWPGTMAVYFQQNVKNEAFAEGITIMTYMRYEEMGPWKDTFNIVSDEQERGDDYEAFKRQRTEKVIDLLEQHLPGLRKSIRSYSSGSPLSFRDYIGTADGSMYGILKDSNDPMRTLISPRTRIPNLYLTGQNLNLHGILGVTMSALVTCSELLGMEFIVDEINQA